MNLPDWISVKERKPKKGQRVVVCSVHRNGDASLCDAMKDAENGGRAVACVEAGAKLHMPDNFAYVYLTDAVEYGLTIKWTVPKNAQQTQVNNQ